MIEILISFIEMLLPLELALSLSLFALHRDVPVNRLNKDYFFILK